MAALGSVEMKEEVGGTSYALGFQPPRCSGVCAPPIRHTHRSLPFWCNGLLEGLGYSMDCGRRTRTTTTATGTGGGFLGAGARPNRGGSGPDSSTLPQEPVPQVFRVRMIYGHIGYLMLVPPGPDLPR